MLQTDNLLQLVPEENNNLIYIHKEVTKIGRGHATTYLGFINTMLTSNFHITMTAYQLILMYVFC